MIYTEVVIKLLAFLYFIGISVIENGNYTIGENVSLSCTTDLGVDVEWIWYRHRNETSVVTSSGDSAVLELSPITASLHGSIYTCRAISTYSIQERRIKVEVQGSYCI